MSIQLNVRVDAANPNHHLWKNHGTWWIHYTLHYDEGRRARRVRWSLGTPDLAEARALRDEVFASFESASVVAGGR